MEFMSIEKNEFLSRNIPGYYHMPYQRYSDSKELPFDDPTNTIFINNLKNTYNNSPENSYFKIKESYQRAYDIMVQDLQDVIKNSGFRQMTITAVPRSKADFTEDQLYFYKAAYDAVEDILRNKLYVKYPADLQNAPLPDDYLESINAYTIYNGIYFGDKTNYLSTIWRIKNTRTTHIKTSTVENDGSLPYRGITLDTCAFNPALIQNQNIILIDDIYTKTANIDEDCIEALYELGAKNVILYCVAKTYLKQVQ